MYVKGGFNMQCQCKDFGLSKSGAQVIEYTLTNKKGNSISLLNYGGTITKIMIADSKGTLKNMVLGYNTLKEYEEMSPFFGCITGRTAGRISGGKFTIANTTYQLEQNEGKNNLHGGPIGLNQRLWSVTEVVQDTYGELVLSHVSDDMDQGFPGTLDISVTYRFDDEDNLTLSYQASTDKETILTLTNHTYFNLSGDPSTTILDHKLTIPADKFVAIGSDSMPIGILETKGTAFDFTTGKAVGQDIDKDEEQIKKGSGYDHPFIMNGKANEKIILSDPKSGRTMEVTTSETCVVCYTGNFLNELDYVFDHKPVKKRGGICLETQYYPDAINADFLPTLTLKPGEIYKHHTNFSFK